MYIAVDSNDRVSYRRVTLRCPICQHYGAFEPLDESRDILVKAGNVSSVRSCPNPTCKALVFIVYELNTNTLKPTFPPERLIFDASNIPAQIKNALEEAITCHANQAYIAAAIMVRKTLEELCYDQRAEGANLQKRLASLGTKIVVPKRLLEAADTLRLLGNDAAHIEARTFNQVSKKEVEIGISLTKELLKAVFQFDDLLAELEGLKRPDI